MRGCRIEGLSNIIGFQTAFHIVESNYFGRDADFSAGGIAMQDQGGRNRYPQAHRINHFKIFKPAFGLQPRLSLFSGKTPGKGKSESKSVKRDRCIYNEKTVK